jgi:hypothetical protein
MSTSDLRKELKELRKKARPTPVSRMKKVDCVREIERLRILHAKEEASEKKAHREEEVAVKKEMKKEAVPKKAAEKVSKVQEKAHKKEEKETKKEHREEEKETAPKKAAKRPAPKEDDDSAPMRPTKYLKGSKEAAEHMARLRAMRKSKKDEE